MNILNRKDFKVVFWQVSVFLFLKLDFFGRDLSYQISLCCGMSQTLYEKFFFQKEKKVRSGGSDYMRLRFYIDLSIDLKSM